MRAQVALSKTLTMLAENEIISAANLTTHIESLKYARIIQQGLLPKPRHFQRLFSDHFVLYKPLHYVSGDFYWVAQKGNLIYIAVGDCTGHGVPGAMLSVLASNIIEYSILNKGILKTNRILDEVDKKFVESFSGAEEDVYNNDWFDVGLVCINTKTRQIYYSAANRKVLHCSQSGAVLYKGDKFPIGGWQYREKREFSTVIFDYEEGDYLYLGSDGFQDQAGGGSRKKYSSKRLHELLEQVHHLPGQVQAEILETEFANWKGTNDQVDDVCLVGIRL